MNTIPGKSARSIKSVKRNVPIKPFALIPLVAGVLMLFIGIYGADWQASGLFGAALIQSFHRHSALYMLMGILCLLGGGILILWPLSQPTGKKRIAAMLRYSLMSVVCFLMLFPFAVMLFTSFKPFEETSMLPIKVLPRNWTAKSYGQVFESFPFLRYLGNTMFLAVFNMAGALLSCPLVAYGLSRIEWRGREALFGITLSVMMIPGAVTMVPVYLIFSKLHMVGTYLPLILPSFCGSAFYIFMMRQFFIGLPKSLEDAARIDGCSELGIYARIFLPLMKPALTTIAVLQMTGTWNDYTGPLLYLNTEKKYTLQFGLHRFTSDYQTDITCQIAAAMLITIPMIVLFFFAQKQFTEGITFSGLKG